MERCTFNDAKRLVRQLVIAKRFRNDESALTEKILWAFTELGEAANAYKKGKRWDDITEELIDTIFSILDFVGLVEKTQGIQIDLDHLFLEKWRRIMEGKKEYMEPKSDTVSTFVAIGVGQGDAFFMEKGERVLLIDGGRSLSSFPAQFQGVTGRNHVTVLTCTHNDSDHGNGVLGFLQEGLVANEVWLPASWMDRLEDLILRPRYFLGELIKDIEDLSENQVTDLCHLGDQYALRKNNKEGKVIEVKAENLYLAFDQCYDVEWAFRMFLPYLHHLLPSNKREMFNEAISASELIREIALAAYHSGSLIRWFDFIGDKNQSNASGGIDGFLVPVNAVEVAQIRRPKRSALEFIALTRSNKQSLVFMSPNDDDSSGVLFTADSDLSFYQQIKWHEHMIITVPHHGSDANKNAYSKFIKETGGKMHVFWVRSDGKFMNRPCQSYLTIKNRKYCTLCRNSKLPKQDVKLVLFNRLWQPLRTRECQCA